MTKNSSIFILLFLSSLILLSFFSGCLPVSPVTVTGTVSGYVALPDDTTKDLTGYSPIPGATVTVVDADGISHTVLTDENGYYYFNNISIKANTIINITKDTEGGGKLIFKDIVPLAVSQEEDYDAGIADAESTTIALVVESLVNLGQVQEEIDLDEITSSDGFDELKEDIQQAQEDNQDINTDLINTQAEEIAVNIVNPPEPEPEPDPDPTPTPTYTVTFDKNGGDTEANPTTKTATHGGNVGTLPTEPTKTGYTFTSWNTAAGGGGTEFTVATAVTADITVYAKWTINSYTVTYNGNGSTGGTVPAGPTSYTYGATVTGLGNTGTLVKIQDGISLLFTGWNTTADGSGTGYIEADTFNMGSANVILYLSLIH